MRFIFTLLIMFFCVPPLAADEIKTGDDLRVYLCETVRHQIAKKHKALKLMETRTSKTYVD